MPCLFRGASLVFLLLSFFLSDDSCAAFVPSALPRVVTRRSTTTTTSQQAALPSSLSIEVPLWLVDASTKVDDSIHTLMSSSFSVFPDEAAQQQLVSTLSAAFLNLNDLNSIISGNTDLLAAATVPWHLQLVTAFALGNVLLFWLNSPDGQQEAPYAPGTMTYDPMVAADFYNQRPLLVVKRILRLALLTGAFNAGVIFDWLVLGKLFKDEDYTALKRAEPRRAKSALRLCERLGPTFIKLGQALSIRTDLIPQAYALELRQLQDAVPPFESEQAFDVMREQLGIDDLSKVFSSISQKPVVRILYRIHIESIECLVCGYTSRLEVRISLLSSIISTESSSFFSFHLKKSRHPHPLVKSIVERSCPMVKMWQSRSSDRVSWRKLLWICTFYAY